MNDGQLNWIGRKLDRYEIEAEIGHGGTAVVYRAFQPQLERWVAIKVLKTRAVANQKMEKPERSIPIATKGNGIR